MSQQKRMTASDLGSLFGGKRTSVPKQVPGFKKKSDTDSLPQDSSTEDNAETTAAAVEVASTQEEPKVALKRAKKTTTPEPLVSEAIPQTSANAGHLSDVVVTVAPKISAPEDDSPVLAHKPEDTHTPSGLDVPSPLESLIPSKANVVSEAISLPEKSEPVVDVGQELQADVHACAETTKEAVVLAPTSEPEEVREVPISSDSTQKASEPQSISLAENLFFTVVEENVSTVAMQEDLSPVPVNGTHPQETHEVSKTMPVTEGREPDVTISSAGMPMVSLTKEDTPVSSPSIPLSTQLDIGHPPISVTTQPALAHEAPSQEFAQDSVRSYPTNGSKHGHDTVTATPVFPGNGQQAVPTMSQHFLGQGQVNPNGFPGPGVGYLPGNGYPLLMNGAYGTQAFSNPMYGIPTFHHGQGVSTVPESFPANTGYVWIPGYPNPVPVGVLKGMEPTHNAVPQQNQNIQTPAPVADTAPVAPMVTHVAAQNLQTAVQETVAATEVAVPTQTVVEKEVMGSTEVEDMEQPNASITASLKMPVTEKQWDGPLGRQMNQFAQNQQTKWQEAQERMRVLARKRQFGFLAPSALLNLMESVAVLWRQETEERMTSKEMFIEGGLMMVETRLQALRSYGFPEEQLQALEQKMEQIKGVIYPQAGSYGE